MPVKTGPLWLRRRVPPKRNGRTIGTGAGIQVLETGGCPPGGHVVVRKRRSGIHPEPQRNQVGHTCGTAQRPAVPNASLFLAAQRPDRIRAQVPGVQGTPLLCRAIGRHLARPGNGLANVSWKVVLFDRPARCHAEQVSFPDSEAPRSHGFCRFRSVHAPRRRLKAETLSRCGASICSPKAQHRYHRWPVSWHCPAWHRQ